MNDQHSDATVTQGRKGLAYDWQSVYVAAQMESLDGDLAALLGAHA
jgi:hypothetical protein